MKEAEAKAFVQRLKWPSIQNHILYGVPASITISQAALESNWGNSPLAEDPANNLFGIKGEGVEMPTTEYVEGIPRLTMESFKKYPSWAKSIEDHADLLTSDRYAQLHDMKPSDWPEGLQRLGYATDPRYAQKLHTIINKHDLGRLDAWGENLGKLIFAVLAVVGTAVFFFL